MMTSFKIVDKGFFFFFHNSDECVLSITYLPVLNYIVAKS